MTQATKEKWSWSERKLWISAIWDHREEAKTNPHLVHTSFWYCVRGTIALILNIENEKIGEWNWNGRFEEIAWRNIHHGFNGEYSTKDWDFLSVSGFQFYIGSDGCP